MKDKEIIKKLKDCKTIDELKAFGKEIDYELTDEEAGQFLKQIMKSGELSDDELNSVSGGGCTRWRNGRAYSGNPDYNLIVTAGNKCRLYQESSFNWGVKGTCKTCANMDNHKLLSLHCNARTYYKDPLNEFKK